MVVFLGLHDQEEGLAVAQPGRVESGWEHVRVLLQGSWEQRDLGREHPAHPDDVGVSCQPFWGDSKVPGRAELSLTNRTAEKSRRRWRSHAPIQNNLVLLGQGCTTCGDQLLGHGRDYGLAGRPCLHTHARKTGLALMRAPIGPEDQLDSYHHDNRRKKERSTNPKVPHHLDGQREVSQRAAGQRSSGLLLIIFQLNQAGPVLHGGERSRGLVHGSVGSFPNLLPNDIILQFEPGA